MNWSGSVPAWIMYVLGWCFLVSVDAVIVCECVCVCVCVCLCVCVFVCVCVCVCVFPNCF